MFIDNSYEPDEDFNVCRKEALKKLREQDPKRQLRSEWNNLKRTLSAQLSNIDIVSPEKVFTAEQEGRRRAAENINSTMKGKSLDSISEEELQEDIRIMKTQIDIVSQLKQIKDDHF